jgi:hypothetical protein
MIQLTCINISEEYNALKIQGKSESIQESVRFCGPRSVYFATFVLQQLAFSRTVLLSPSPALTSHTYPPYDFHITCHFPAGLKSTMMMESACPSETFQQTYQNTQNRNAEY